MCSSSPNLPPPVAQAVPLPLETSKPAVVDVMAPKLRRSGRSRLTVPASGSSTTTGMSGLNIPK